MHTTAAPAARASSGNISGVGLAQANITASRAMVFTPMNTSAPRTASASVPLIPRGFVTAAISALTALSPSRPAYIVPRRSQSVMSSYPALSKSRAMEIAAAPAPFITMRAVSFPTTFSAFVSPASTMTAVPCWSSWNTGMSHSSLSRRSISKQRGAEMSSRLIPPNEPDRRYTVRTNSSTSCVFMQSGKASTLPKLLKSTHLPSITGMPASGPMSPSPRTAEPSVITAHKFHRRVSS